MKEKFNVIVTKHCVYIESRSVYHFDGVEGEATNKHGWLKISKIPSKIEIKNSGYCNTRYELKYDTTGFAKILSTDDYDSEADWASLYEYKYDRQDVFTPIDFEIVIIANLDDFVPVNVHPKYKNYLIDEIETHPALLQNKPVFISSEESYKIIRNHIKAHINPKVARITSDYDFCLTVNKIVEYEKPYSYKADVSSLKAKKPKYEVKWKTSESVKCFEIAPERNRDGVYGEYPRCEEFRGKTVEELEENIQKYLDDLMKKINSPAKVCSCCNGRGIVE